MFIDNLTFFTLMCPITLGLLQKSVNFGFWYVFFAFAPEFYLFSLILVVLCYNVFLKAYFNAREFVNYTILFALPFLLFIIAFLHLHFDYSCLFFNSHFLVNNITVYIKIFIVLLLLLVMLFSLDYFLMERFQVAEYVMMLLLALLGMFILVTANDLIPCIYR